jgi:hypothetical protein
MKTISLKNLCATTSLLVGLVGMSSAQADVQNGAFGFAAASMDVYVIVCPAGTASVRANVNDGPAAGVLVSLQIIDPQGGATNVTAPDGGGVSATIGLPATPGISLVLVDKTPPASAEGYTAIMDCFNAGGAAAPGNQSFLVQNQ